MLERAMSSVDLTDLLKSGLKNKNQNKSVLICFAQMLSSRLAIFTINIKFISFNRYN